MSFEVATPAVRDAGRSMIRAGRQLAEQTPHTAVADLPGALHGTRTAATAQTLAGLWQRRFLRLAEAVELHGRLLVADADDYELSDARVDRALSGPAPGPRGRNIPERP